MNWPHFRAILWLRWRLGANQLRRAGAVNTLIMTILAAIVIVLGMGLFGTFFSVGRFALAQASAAVVMYVWDGLVAAMLFFWTVGLMAELQRSEALSLTKLLHLPVSLTSAFFINYLSSLASVTLVLFLPAMLGLSLGLVFARGWAMLWLLPLLAAFLLMVTAITYQFQSWLASLMVNKRRRRTIILIITVSFILIFQLPNLLNILGFGPRRQVTEPFRQVSQEKKELEREFSSGAIDAEQYRQREEEINREFKEQMERIHGRVRQVEQTARLLNMILPPGWLPLGAWALAEGSVWPALLGTLALSLIGSASLWRSYRTTVRLYTGQFTSGKKRPVGPASRRSEPTTGETPVPPKKPSRLLEKELPWLPEHASAIALAGFRSLLRAPEAKLMLLGPIILTVIFGVWFLRSAPNPSPPIPRAPGYQPDVALPEIFRPLIPFGAMTMVLLSLGRILGNQFGFDRSGFRVYVLCPARRRDILLGKNLAVAPLALVLCLGMVVIMQIIRPMRFDHFLAAVPQFLSMYLLFCLLANCLSILAPMPIASGSLRPTQYKMVPMLLHLAFVMLVFPLAVGPALLPLISELVVEELTGSKGIPICLILSLLECVAVVYLYRFILDSEGRWLQAREKKILEIVAAKAE